MLDDVDIGQEDTVHSNIKPAQCAKEITQMSRSTSLKGYYNDKRSSISSNAIMRKQVTYSNCHRQTVRITTAEMDKEQSYPRCSYISTSDEGGMYCVNV